MSVYGMWYGMIQCPPLQARQVRTRNADFNSASAGGGGGGQRPRVPSAEGERRQGVGAGKAVSDRRDWLGGRGGGNPCLFFCFSYEA